MISIEEQPKIKMNLIKSQTLLLVGSSGLVGGKLRETLLDTLDATNTLITANRNEIKSFSAKNSSKCRHIHIYLNATKRKEWVYVLDKFKPNTIILVSNCRHFYQLNNAISETNIDAQKLRLIIIGTTGVFSPNQKYSMVYKEIELLLNMSNFKNFVLLRPSLIFGTSSDKNIHKVINFIKYLKFIPLLPNGNGTIQPVYYLDVVEAIINSIKNKKIKGFYNITGNDCISYTEMYQIIFFSMRLKPRFIKLPRNIAILLASLCEFIFKDQAIITIEKVNRLIENKCFSNKDSVSIGLYNPTSFVKGIKSQIESMNIN